MEIIMEKHCKKVTVWFSYWKLSISSGKCIKVCKGNRRLKLCFILLWLYHVSWHLCNYHFPQIINGVNICILGFLLLIIVAFLENETYSRLQVSVCQHDYLRNSLPRKLKFKSIVEGQVYRCCTVLLGTQVSYFCQNAYIDNEISATLFLAHFLQLHH